MQIANPRYDAVFKFFMEDNEVAKRLISNIIEQIVSTNWQKKSPDLGSISDADL